MASKKDIQRNNIKRSQENLKIKKDKIAEFIKQGK